MTVRKAGGDNPVEYLVYDMDEVFITNVSTSGSDGGGIATESVSLNFAKMTVTYTEQNADGSAGAATPKWYSVKEHTFRVNRRRRRKFNAPAAARAAVVVAG